jgi:hypothetical protein
MYEQQKSLLGQRRRQPAQPTSGAATKYNLETDYTTEEEDDYLHRVDGAWDTSSHALNLRGFLNVLTLSILALGLFMLFLGYPILMNVRGMYDHSTKGSFGLGGTNGSSQVPELDIVSLIDKATPQKAMKWISGSDQSSYHLVFSDEFEVDG